MRISVVRVRDPLTVGVTRFVVDRSTPLGNPYHVSMGRAECVAAFAANINWDDPRIVSALNPIRETLTVGPVELACHCAPLLCHAEVIRAHLLGVDFGEQLSLF